MKTCLILIILAIPVWPEQTCYDAEDNLYIQIELTATFTWTRYVVRLLSLFCVGLVVWLRGVMR